MKKIIILFVSILIVNCSKESEPTMYTLTVTSNPTEGGTISPSGGEYEDGTEVTINVTPNNNFSFKEWSGGWSGTESPLTIIMDGNKTLVGNFNFLDSDGDGVGDDDDLDNSTRRGVPVDENGVMLNPIYLDENGVTIKSKEWGTFGDTGEVNGVEYTIGRFRDILTWINEGRNLNQLCTTKITLLQYGFSSSVPPNFTGDISNWDVSNVTSMYGLFINSEFNGDISKWDVSSVVDMERMFDNSQFNGDISNWDVSSVMDMDTMFDNSQFNGDISNWDVSNVTSMDNSMFGNSQFNGDISNWDVSNVTRMGSMFSGSTFNGDISNWDVSSVVLMWYMFSNSHQFNQDLSNWDVSNVTNCSDFSGNSPQYTLPKPNFTNCNPQ